MTWWHIYLVVWGTAAILAAAFTAAAWRMGSHAGMVDLPNREAHKKHRREVPLLGGPAICLAWAATMAGGAVTAAWYAGYVAPEVQEYLPGIRVAVPKLLCIGIGGLGMTLLGLLDDFTPLHASFKLAGQLIVAAIVTFCGIRVVAFIPWPVVSWIVTVGWIVLVVNAVNFFDNMDGLAAGTAAIAGLLFLVAAAAREQYFVAVLAAATCGASAGFLAFNWPPARIFMGDAGSHFLGYSLAVVGAMTTYYEPGHSGTAAPILIPLIVLALPIFDFFAVVFIRHVKGKPIYVGDQSHISHRFARMGLSRTYAVILLHLLSFAIGAGAITLLWLPLTGAVIVLFQSAAVLTVVTLLHLARIGQSEGGENDAEQI